jgi:WD40 repeat protein
MHNIQKNLFNCLVLLILIPFLLACASQSEEKIIPTVPMPTNTQTTTPTEVPTPTPTLTPTETSTPQPTNTPTLSPTPYRLAYDFISVGTPDSPYSQPTIKNLNQLKLRKVVGIGRPKIILFNQNADVVVVADAKTCFLDKNTLSEKQCFYIPKGENWEDQGWRFWIALSPDSQWIFNRISWKFQLRNIVTGETNDLNTQGIENGSFSKDGKLLATNLGIYTVETRAVFTRFSDEVKDRWIFDDAFSPDGKYLATYSPPYAGNSVSIVDVARGDLILNLTVGGTLWTAAQTIKEIVSFSPDSRFVAFALIGPAANGKILTSGNGNVVVYDIEEREKIWQSSGVSEINDVSFSPTGDLFAFTSELGKTITIWDTREWVLVKELRSDTHFGYQQVKFSADGTKVFATSSYRTGIPTSINSGCARDPDYRVYLWDLEIGNEPVFSAKGGESADQSLIDFSPDGKNFLFVSGSAGCNQFNESQLVMMNLEYFTKVADYSLQPANVLAILDNYLASGSADGKISLWDLSTGEFIRSFGGQSGIIEDIRSDGVSFLVSSSDKLWTGKECVNTKVQLWNSNGSIKTTLFEESVNGAHGMYSYKPNHYCIDYVPCGETWRSEAMRVMKDNLEIICDGQACRNQWWETCISSVYNPNTIQMGNFNGKPALIFYNRVLITGIGGLHTYNPARYGFELWAVAP